MRSGWIGAVAGLLVLAAPSGTAGQGSRERLLGRNPSLLAGLPTSTLAVEPAPSNLLEGAVDPEVYVLGPGDVLEVVYTGRSQPPERVRVTPSGKIHLAPTGPVTVAGQTLAEAEVALRRILARFYEKTRISVDLVEIRRFRVHILGHVSEPGAYEMSAASRASDLLGRQGELRDRVSLRAITLRRKGGAELPVDLARYRLLGDLSANPFLEDGDVLLVSAQRDSVSIFGRVPRPGFFEYRWGDTVDDLIALAGGLDSGADADAVELRRFETPGTDATQSRILNLTANEGHIELLPGDGVYVRSQPDWRRERLVQLTGEVRYPGVYPIEKEKETLRSLISRAGGLTEDAEPTATEVFRPNVFDVPEDDPEFRRLQSIPVQEMSNEEYEYLKLRSRQREGLASSVLASGLGAPEGGPELVLRSGDRVKVPRQNRAVDVQGAVKNPGFVPYDPEWVAEDYIEVAGGISDRARTSKTRVIRSRTGEWVKAEPGTRIDPGDLVWVPEKPARNWWRITRETVVFLAQIGTIIVVIKSI